jgi:hypothetical protein
LRCVGDDGADEVAETKSFIDSLRDLVLFCSEHDALKWKEIWTNWRYSEAVEFGIRLAQYKTQQREQLEGIEDPMAMMLTLLMQKLR